MPGIRAAVIIAARRTPVVPKGGAFCQLQADELVAPVLAQLIKDGGIGPDQVDQVILGNALYGGGNLARLAALRAGLPPSVPAMTIDTQCCSGLDAILAGIRLVEAGAANCVLAGGTESFSRAPIRMHRPLNKDQSAEAYDRPPFAPAPYLDPDLAQAATQLAEDREISRERQVNFAVESHRKAVAAAPGPARHLVQVGEARLERDAFTRDLTYRTAMRAPVLTGNDDTGLSAATIACEADGAAAVLIVAEPSARLLGRNGLKVLDGMSVGCDPAMPALGPIDVGRKLLDRIGLEPESLDCVELMEAYAIQAMVTEQDLGIETEILNPLGGALARGHPIGASGAILAVQLYESLAGGDLSCRTAQSTGMALIAAAGGLASGLLVQSV